MPRLTKYEELMLKYPPTQGTWICPPCDAINSSREAACWFCGKAKPAIPQLLWPTYERICKKAGIEPGEKWVKAEPLKAPSVKSKVRRVGKR